MSGDFDGHDKGTGAGIAGGATATTKVPLFNKRSICLMLVS